MLFPQDGEGIPLYAPRSLTIHLTSSVALAEREPHFCSVPQKSSGALRAAFWPHLEPVPVQETEKYTHDPALGHMPNPGTRKKGQWKGVNRR